MTQSVVGLVGGKVIDNIDVCVHPTNTCLTCQHCVCMLLLPDLPKTFLVCVYVCVKQVNLEHSPCFADIYHLVEILVILSKIKKHITW